MKRLLFVLAVYLTLTASLVLPARVTAADRVDVVNSFCQSTRIQALPPDQRPAECQDNQSGTSNLKSPIFGPHGVITIAIQLLTLAAGVIVIFVIIISGVRFVTSTGDPNSVTQARNALLYGIVGLAIVAAAQAIVTFVLSKL